MKFYIDTANLDDIKAAASIGILDGVTTNPTLLSREAGKGTYTEILKEICSAVDGPVSAEVVSLNSKGMISEAKELAKIADNIVIKIPMCEEGLKAVKHLENNNIRCNVTLVFTAMQALLAAKAGASFCSPFVGRIDDIASYGMEIVRDIVTIFNNYELETEVIVASIRNPLHVLEAAIAGADIATIPYKVIQQLIKHPLTDRGIEKFLEDWKKVQK